MADFHPKKSYISKTRSRLQNRLDGGNCTRISYWPPPLVPLWYCSSELQARLLAISTTPLTVISLLLYLIQRLLYSLLTCFNSSWSFWVMKNNSSRRKWLTIRRAHAKRLQFSFTFCHQMPTMISKTVNRWHVISEAPLVIGDTKSCVSRFLERWWTCWRRHAHGRHLAFVVFLRW